MILSIVLSALSSFSETGSHGMPGIEAPRTLGTGVLRLQLGRERTMGGLLVAAEPSNPASPTVTSVDLWRFGAIWGLGSWTDLGMDGSFQIESGVLSSREYQESGFSDTWIRLRHQIPLDGIGGLSDLLFQGALGLPTGARGVGRWPIESFQQPGDGTSDPEGSTAQGGAGMSWGMDVSAGFDLRSVGFPLATYVQAGARGTEADGRDPQLRAGGGLEGRMGPWATGLAGMQWRAPLHRGTGDAWTAIVAGIELRPASWVAVQFDLRQVLDAGPARRFEVRRDGKSPVEPLTVAQVAGTQVAVRVAIELRRPSPDSDGDGLADLRDRCPSAPEDRDGSLDEDGCPDPDDDLDGVCDAWVSDRDLLPGFAGRCRGRDACPSAKEDLDGFEDVDGCPDPDNDRDGLCDREGAMGSVATCRGFDRCPLQPEDFDAFQDEDGCKDADNDADGIPDPLDACPDGAPDSLPGGSDGCPSRSIPPAVEPSLPDTAFPRSMRWIVPFEVGSDALDDRADSIVSSVRRILSSSSSTRVGIEGHADLRGEAEYNQELSERRAKAVLESLVAGGVERSRLRSSGRGFSAPVDLNFEEEGRARNRRVEIVLERSEP